VPARVLARYGGWTEDVRAVAQTLLVGRRAWARALLEAADTGAIDAATLPAETVRKATVFRDEGIAEIVRRRFSGSEGASTAEMQAEMERLTRVLAAAGGDPYRGKKLYAETCGKCHLLHGVGGRIGPDLTPFRRDDVPRMLHSIVHPSAEIREGYEAHVATTADGRVVQGLLVEEDPQVLVLRDAAGQTVTLERGEIEERRILRTSLMPEGQLKPLSDAEIRDLFAYLRTAQPVVD
jgi:putative heme-binding domain-containing protein